MIPDAGHDPVLVVVYRLPTYLTPAWHHTERDVVFECVAHFDCDPHADHRALERYLRATRWHDPTARYLVLSAPAGVCFTLEPD